MTQQWRGDPAVPVARRALVRALCATGAVAATGALAALGAGAARAQSFPERPLRLVVPYPPGGVTDILGRAIGKVLGDELGQPVVIENRPGANGSIGVEAIARAPADGYSVVLGASSTHVLNPLLYKPPYDAQRDFTPLGMIAATPLVLVVDPNVPATDLPSLVGWLRAQGGRASFGSYGNASASHLAGELFKSMAQVQMTHVPYKGAAPAQADLMAGQISLMFSDLSAMTHVRSGKLRALAVTGGRRSVSMPELPTVAEAGVPGYEVLGWFALFGPPALPAPVAERLSAALAKVTAATDLQQRLIGLGLEPSAGGGAAVARLIATDTTKWAKVISDARIRIE